VQRVSVRLEAPDIAQRIRRVLHLTPFACIADLEARPVGGYFSATLPKHLAGRNSETRRYGITSQRAWSRARVPDARWSAHQRRRRNARLRSSSAISWFARRSTSFIVVLECAFGGLPCRARGRSASVKEWGVSRVFRARVVDDVVV